MGAERVAGWTLSLNRRPLPAGLRGRLLELGVFLGLEQASRFHARFSDPDLSLADGDDFPFGAQVDISLEYAGSSQAVFQGELTAWGVERTVEGTTFLVRGLDRSHRLRRGRRHRFLEVQDDAALVRSVAGDYGLQARADAPPPGSRTQRGGQLQLGISDHQLLRDRARRMSVRQRVIERGLHLEKVRYTAPPATLSGEERLELYDFEADLGALPTKVEVIGWDVAKNARFQGEASATELGWRGDGSRTGVQQAKQAFGEAVHILADLQPADAAEAKAIARAYLQHAGERYVRGAISVREFPKVRPGERLKLEAPDFPLSGAWLVESVHYLLLEGGGKTRLELVRPDVG